MLELLLGLLILPDGSEVRQDPDKILDDQYLVLVVICACSPSHLEHQFVQVLNTGVVGEHCVDNPVTERVDTELWDVDDVLPHQISLPSLVQSLKPVIEPGDLTQGKPGLLTGTALLVILLRRRRRRRTNTLTLP